MTDLCIGRFILGKALVSCSVHLVSRVHCVHFSGYKASHLVCKEVINIYQIHNRLKFRICTILTEDFKRVASD